MAPAARAGSATALKGPACAAPGTTLAGCPLSLDELFGYSKLQEVLAWIIARLGDHDSSFELLNNSCKAAALLGEKANGELKGLGSELQSLSEKQRGFASEATIQNLRSELRDANARMGDFASTRMVQEIRSEMDDLRGSQSKFALDANVGDLRKLLDNVRGSVETFPTRWSASIVEGVAPMEAACTELDHRVAAMERSYAEFEQRITSRGMNSPAEAAANAGRNAKSENSCTGTNADMKALLEPIYEALDDLRARIQQNVAVSIKFESRFNALETSLDGLIGNAANHGHGGAGVRAGASDGEGPSLSAPGHPMSGVDQQSVDAAEAFVASTAALNDQIAQNKQLEHRLAVLETSVKNLGFQNRQCGEDGVRGASALSGGAVDGSEGDPADRGGMQSDVSRQHIDVETALGSLRQEIQDELRRQHSKLQGLDGAVQKEMHPRLDEMSDEINKNSIDVTNLNVQLTHLMHQLSQHTAATAKCLSCSNERSQRGNQVVFGSDGKAYKRTSIDGGLRLPQLNAGHKKIPNFGGAGAPLRPRDIPVNGLEKGAFGAMSTGALDGAV
eukprot:TRINITY_DN7126_c0_g2_i1.p1 TRINITY_DN7126_c0_g2~~TRINITY_DN7126_c0_g2_i1.p1  ORF type:complete len:562 (-),score=104.93 TRINITY_DN7126_c0_g2_i1:169-1854(-)